MQPSDLMIEELQVENASLKDENANLHRQVQNNRINQGAIDGTSDAKLLAQVAALTSESEHLVHTLNSLKRQLDVAQSALVRLGACPVCGQVPNGQHGEYPCELCGLPTVWDEVQP